MTQTRMPSGPKAWLPATTEELSPRDKSAWAGSRDRAGGPVFRSKPAGLKQQRQDGAPDLAVKVRELVNKVVVQMFKPQVSVVNGGFAARAAIPSVHWRFA